MTNEPEPDCLLDAAIACHQSGSLDQAEAAYRQILQRDPDDLDALNLLGLLLQDRQDFAGSIALLSRAITLDPEFAEALVNLARAQNGAGDPEAATSSALRAIALEPELAEAHLQHGRSLLSLGQDRAAVEACRRAAALLPGSADAHADLGMALLRTGDAAAAVASFRTALVLQPGSARILHNLATALLKQGEAAQAVDYAGQAVAIAPDEPVYCAGLAKMLRENRDIAASEEACSRALALAPDRADMWLLQGENLSANGHFDDAARCYTRALELDANLAQAQVGLAVMGRLNASDPHVAQMQAAMHDADRPITDRIAIGFGLGATFDRAGDHDSAFACYAAANRWAHERFAADGHAFDADGLSERMNWMMNAFGPDIFQATQGWGDPSELPVFVVGMPRSGTTLVEQILASHPQVFGAGERKDIPNIVQVLEDGPPLRPPLNWDREEVRHQTASHLDLLQQLGGKAVRVVDKLPDNVLLLGHLAILFPRARIVLCRRDLRDVGLSCFFQSFSDGMPWSFDLSECAFRIGEVERITEYWKSILPSPVLEVRYESLVADLEGEAKRLIAFIGLAWDPACLGFHKTDRTVMTASAWQVRQPLYNSSVGRWRKYQQHIGPLLDGSAGLVPASGSADDRDTPEQVLSAIQVHRDAGRLGAAEAACRALLAEHPSHPDALCTLGQILCERQDYVHALPLFQRAAELQPDDAGTLLELGRLHLRFRNIQAAADVTSRAILLAPDDAVGHLLSGLVLLEQDDTAHALAQMERATELDPDSFDAWLNYATLLIRLENYQDAAAGLQAALALRPDHLEALSKLGFALSQLEEHEQALAVFRNAVALAPTDPRPRHGLVLALWRKGDAPGTIEACERAVELDANQADIWLIFGQALAAMGRFAEATTKFEQALRIDPSYLEAQVGLAQLQTGGKDPEEFHRLSQILHDPDRTDRERVAAGFALASMLDKQGQFDAAFAAAMEANRLRRGMNIQPGTWLNTDALLNAGRPGGDAAPAVEVPFRVDKLREIFPPEVFLATADWGVQSQLPVFVVGLPRSGTSLVEQIVASHPAAFGSGENRDIHTIIGHLERGKAYRPPFEWDRHAVTREAAAYVDKLRSVGGGAIRVVDKMPDNIQFLGHIRVLFPRARIVICRRDLRDVAVSCFFQYFAEIDWTNNLHDLARHARETARLMSLWRERLPGPVLEIQYETLIANQEAESRRLIDFLGLDWDPACLDFHQTERAVRTASHWQVRQPLYASSVGRWRNYRQHLGPLLEGLEGYVSGD